MNINKLRDKNNNYNMNITDYNTHFKTKYDKCQNAIGTPEFYNCCEDFCLDFDNFLKANSNAYEILTYSDEDIELLELEHYRIINPNPYPKRNDTDNKPSGLMQLLQYGAQDIAIVGYNNNIEK